jgi:hypothetical protein
MRVCGLKVSKVGVCVYDGRVFPVIPYLPALFICILMHFFLNKDFLNILGNSLSFKTLIGK